MSEDYKVGDKRPPKHAQWKKGQSGNPAGRPKGSRNLSSIFWRLLFTPVTVRRGARLVRIPAVEAAGMVQLKKATDGKDRSFQMLIDLAVELERLERQEQAPAPMDTETRRRTDKALLDTLKARLVDLVSEPGDER